MENDPLNKTDSYGELSAVDATLFAYVLALLALFAFLEALRKMRCQCEIPTITNFTPIDEEPVPGLLQMGKGKLRQHRGEGVRKGKDKFIKYIKGKLGQNYEDTSELLHDVKGGIDDNNDADFNGTTGDFATPGGELLS